MSLARTAGGRGVKKDVVVDIFLVITTYVVGIASPFNGGWDHMGWSCSFLRCTHVFCVLAVWVAWGLWVEPGWSSYSIPLLRGRGYFVALVIRQGRSVEWGVRFARSRRVGDSLCFCVCSFGFSCALFFS